MDGELAVMAFVWFIGFSVTWAFLEDEEDPAFAAAVVYFFVWPLFLGLGLRVILKRTERKP